MADTPQKGPKASSLKDGTTRHHHIFIIMPSPGPSFKLNGFFLRKKRVRGPSFQLVLPQTAFPAEIRSVGTQTSIFTTDMGTSQQWRSTQGAHGVELQRLQHRTNLIITQIGKLEQGATESLSTGALHGSQDRIKSITLDIDTLDRSCSAETAVGFAPTGSSPRKKNPPFSSFTRKSLKRQSSPLDFDTGSHHRIPRQRTTTPTDHKEVATLSPQDTKDFFAPGEEATFA